MPVKTPVLKPMVATAVLLLLQVPPEAASESVAVEPIHATVLPDIGLVGLTVTVAVAAQPDAFVKVIVAEPPEIPVTTPLPAPIVAIARLPLLQVPVTVVSLSVIVPPAHTGVLPVMAPGELLTVTTVVAIQPEDTL